MTIRRQYSLPNCTLIIEGLSDGTSASGQPDPRPMINIVVNAECHFAGQRTPLTGGREFFESLVNSVSNYAQEFLSGVPHPVFFKDKPVVVQLHKGSNKNLHRLTYQLSPVADAVAAGGSVGQKADMPHQMQIELTTVQLFDLVDAVDQFLADGRTLPELTVPLQPVSKRYAATHEPLAKRAVPAAVGVGSLAAAAIAFSFIPTPKVQPPKVVTSQPTSQATPSPTPSSTASPVTASDLEGLVAAVPEITDPTQLYYLQRKLYNQLNEAWKDRNHFSRNLVYRVGVGKDGAILAYKPVNKAANQNADATPLPKLSYIPTNGTTVSTESLAQFKAVFTDKGVLQVSPWNGYSSKPSLGAQIVDEAQLSSLQQQLQDQLKGRWQGSPNYKSKLTYRVGVNKDGAIADYEPNTQSAFDYVQDTPLPDLLKAGNPTGAVPQEPLAQFKVVLKSNGSVDISPWKQ